VPASELYNQLRTSRKFMDFTNFYEHTIQEIWRPLDAIMKVDKHRGENAHHDGSPSYLPYLAETCPKLHAYGQYLWDEHYQSRRQHKPGETGIIPVTLRSMVEPSKSPFLLPQLTLATIWLDNRRVYDSNWKALYGF
jgi:hypothetical protein